MFRSRLSAEAFARLIHLYADNVEGYRIAQEIGTSRVTVSRILNALRKRMAAYARCLGPSDDSLAIPAELLAQARGKHIRGRRPTSDLPVASIACIPPTVACSLAPHFPRALWRYLDLEVGGLEALRGERLFGEAAALLDLQSFEIISLSPPREPDGVRFRSDEMRLVEAFATFAHGHLQRARGVPEDKLWLYLAEAEFRFNRRDQDLAAVIFDMLRMKPLRLSE